MIKQLLLGALLFAPATATMAQHAPIKRVHERSSYQRPDQHPAKARAVYPTYTSLFEEGFESGKMPEGWSQISTTTRTWTVVKGDAFNPVASSGTHAMCFEGDNDGTEATLISEMVALEDHMEVLFHARMSYTKFFGVEGSGFDWLDGKQRQIANFEVLVQEEGTTAWTVVKDFAAELMGKTIAEVKAMPGHLHYATYRADLSAFAGKNIRVAFRVSGQTNGEYMLDDVRVATPETTGAAYTAPASVLYWVKDQDGNTPAERTMYLPAGQEMMFRNTTANLYADYQWKYQEPGNGNATKTATTPNLSVLFKPWYVGGVPVKYDAPTLTATCDGYETSVAHGPVDKIMVGPSEENGKRMTIGHISPDMGAIIPVAGEYVNTPFELITTSDKTYITDVEPSAPIFGYSTGSVDWWTQYIYRELLYNGQNLNEGVYGTFAGFYNLFEYLGAPLIVRGASLYARAQMQPDAILFVEAWPNSEEHYYLDDNGTEPYTTKTIQAADIPGMSATQVNDVFVYIPFDKPFLSDCHLRLQVTGFDDKERTTYFAPYITAANDAEDYLRSEIAVECGDEESLMRSWNGTWEISNPDGSYRNSTFYLMLDADYVIFTDGNDDHSFAADADHTTKSFTFAESHYLPTDFTITANTDDGLLPAWLTAEISGRFLDQKVTFNASQAEYVSKGGLGTAVPDVITCEVTVAAPGMTPVVFTVNQSDIKVVPPSEGIGTIEATTHSNVTYDLTGRRVNAGSRRGVYVKNGAKVIM